MHRPTLAIILTTVFLSGCGLSDYERKIDEQQERIREVDEQAKMLGEPLQLPVFKEGDEEIPRLRQWGVFLVPPKIISSELVAEDAFGNPKFLYRYAGPEGYNIFLGAKPRPAKDKEPAVDDQQSNPKANAQLTFFDQVEFALRFYCYQQWKVGEPLIPVPPAKSIESRQITVNSFRVGNLPPADTVLTEYVLQSPEKVAEPARFQIYTLAKDQMEIAVVYQYPEKLVSDRKAFDEWQKTVENSLKTLQIGARGEQRMMIYQRAKMRK